MNRVRLFPLVILLVVLSNIFISCAVFEAIGDSLSQFYDNSVSYFNAYYNAKQVFTEAEEVVLVAQRDARAKVTSSQQSVAPPTTARDKFNAVIDKCSSILSFYPQSSLVDDALLLIGKSYYFLQDYLKAERKFSELLAQYPNSSLALEGQLWFVKTLERLRKNEEAKLAAAQLAQTAIEQEEPTIAAEAYTLLGLVAENEDAPESAIDSYTKALEYAQDDFTIATLLAKVGDLHFSLKDYEKANAAYIKVYEQGVSDVYLNYYGRIQAARGYAALKRYDTAVYLTGEMLDDYRFSAYHQAIRLEYAGILLASGYTLDALDEYQYMDTAYVRTETGSGASFALGQYYETQIQNYPRARFYYARASSVPAAPVAQKARQRDNAIGRILTYHRELFQNDSLVALSDSMKRYPEKFLPPDTLRAQTDSVQVQADTVQHAVTDSLFTQPDSLASKTKEPRVVFKPVDPDSQRVLSAKIAYDLGEVYYTEMDIPDSALAWFQKALEWKVDSTRAPRALFILAELQKTTGKGAESSIAEMYRRIMDDYPWSNYAHEVRRILGLQVTQRSAAQDDRAYAVAESLLWGGEYSAAIEQLKTVARESPSSLLAAKSQYALGWIYENYLSQPDSALFYYKSVVDQYKTSPYAAAVRNRISGTKPDEKQEQAPAPIQPGDIQEKQKQDLDLDDNAPSPRRQRAREAKADTTKVKIKE